ncbi:MAG: ornithine aminomutase [Spirochaetales bacterium]|jgi:D-ornithine 4,5-aminomutase subunit alpha|nr:ornithine aminomutase subunit alpha [Exilispira sp.]NMC68333.1 ornithine aminomutase [Spirochaetales bacterium]
MKSGLERKDDFQLRRAHLANLSDEELKKRFWELTEKIVNPMIDLAKKYTSPSIERSVLLRMGFNSIEANKIVDILYKKDLLGHGVGNVILKISKKEKINYLDAGKKIIEGYPCENLF